MSARIHYASCPVCNSNEIHPLLTVKDHSVSKEEFVVWQCNQCSLRFTQDVPDEDSIGSYYQSPDYISHTNTSEGVLHKVYQRVRRFTLAQKANLVEKVTGLREGGVLDVGCGIGAFLSVMKDRGWRVEGTEPDAGARKLGRELYGLSLKESSGFFEFKEGSFDVITLWHVLEHVHLLHPYVERLNALLKKEGRLLIAVPNYWSLDADLYRSRWAAYDVPRHLYHFTPKAMHTLMQQHGLKILEKKPMWFDSFYVSLLSSKYRNGTTNWLGAGFNGLRSNIRAMFNKDRCSSIIYIIGK